MARSMTDHGGAASPRTDAGKRLLANMAASDGWGDATYGVRLRTNPEEWRVVILTIEDEAAGLPPEWVWERRPGDDAECERLGCEDRTHLVQHVRRRAVQEAPAPEGLRAALAAIPHGARPGPGLSSVGGWNRYDTDDKMVLHVWANDERSPGGQSWDIRLPKAATPPTPAEPPRPEAEPDRCADCGGAYHGPICQVEGIERAEARPPEGRDAAYQRGWRDGHAAALGFTGEARSAGGATKP